MTRSSGSPLWWIGAAAALCLGCSSDEPGDDGAPGGSGGLAGAGGDAGAPTPPGGPEACPAGSCNYQTQSGCQSGQACRPTVDDAASSVTPSCGYTDGPGAEGAACSDWNDCSAGSLCIAGVCRRMCCGGDWSACGAEASCYGTLAVMSPSSGTVYPSGVGICLPTGNCDPFQAGSCGDQACHIVDARGSVGCVPPGDGQPGDACNEASDCSQGTACVGSRCRELCRLEAGARGCSDASPCVHYSRHPAGVGECVPTTP